MKKSDANYANRGRGKDPGCSFEANNTTFPWLDRADCEFDKKQYIVASDYDK